ncbi:hypothetical protein CLOSPI_01377 [Thomasclavelia spiroformis DSM 1552]|uniref:Uncharacterized protein n=1 Tax=Thomasclavelia spiroformis DSM 1552 TaxID=428126 RepID=B1C2B8_9FIRM|nr:hypothetical protein CLOSPI_01377 [Thomasclavelia spiroformis DSM 1552]
MKNSFNNSPLFYSNIFSKGDKVKNDFNKIKPRYVLKIMISHINKTKRGVNNGN